MAIVYQHRRLDTNEIFYIGIELDTNKRKAIGKRAFVKYHRSKYWDNIVNKTDYSIEILFNDLTNEESKEIEKYLIKFYGRRDLGLGSLVNLTDGGDGCVNLIISDYHKNQIRKNLKNIPRTKKVKDKISNSNKGKIRTLEHRKKYSILLKQKYKEGYISPLSKKVIDFSTNIIYCSLKEACLNLNLNYSATRAQISGQNKNNTNLKYY